MKCTAIFAAGCFWGVEHIFRAIDGVLNTEVGYCGGTLNDPTYHTVKTGTSGHAEAVMVEFDDTLVSYSTLLDYFFRLHDPTTPNQQGNDIGTQYRSAIFYLNETQKLEAENAKLAAAKSGRWRSDIVTQIVPAPQFFPAEDYHQDYLLKNPDGYNCHYLRK